MSEIEKIRAEIERRKNNAETLRERNICIDILTFIDTLESEKPFMEPIDGVLYAATCGIKNKGQIKKLEKPVPDDLDKAARKSAVAPFNFELDEEHLYEYPYLPIAEQKFKEGAKWQKEQMVREAVEGVVFGNVYEHWVETGIDEKLSYLNPGDKVRIIIVKD